MKYYLLRHLSALALAAPAVLGVAAGVNEWEYPQVNSVNRLPARTYSLPLESEDAALTDLTEPETPYARSLNGKWKFSWAGNLDLREKDFWQTDYDDADWFLIDVPSCVEMKGFGSPGYTNVRYPHADLSNPTNSAFAKILDRSSGKPCYNPVSSYRTRFEVPESWSGREVVLRFDGVGSAFYVWVNGKRVGYAEDSRLPSEFDITPYLKQGQGGRSTEGENLLCVEVYRWCDGSYLEDQDMFRFSGIFRDVTLWAKPKDGVWDFNVKTTPVEGYEKWKLEVKVEGQGQQRTEVSLYDADKKKVADLRCSPSPASFTFSTTLAARAWSAEDPYLYTLVIRRGEDIRMKRVGFKEQKVVGNRFLVNGRPVKLHGVNRHDCSPDNGCAVTRTEMLADIRLMKRHNVDTVRTSHYPNHRFWYDLCDRYGLYVIAEANVEGHEPGFSERGLGRFAEWEHAIVERNVRQVTFYRNNPSVTLWSVGNETGHGDCFRHAIAAVRSEDPSRPVHWERGNRDADVDSRMYPWVYWLEERGKLGELPRGMPFPKDAFVGLSADDDQSAGKPMLMCEYAHAMGNALGDLDEYWKVIYRYDALMGGCIWDWADQAIWKGTGRMDPVTGCEERYLAYGGDFDEEPNDGPFCCNGIVGADRHATAKLAEVGHVYRPFAVTGGKERSFVLENRRHFRSTADCEGRWAVRCDGVITASGDFDVPIVAPGATGRVVSGELQRALDRVPSGREVLVDFAIVTRTDRPWASRGWTVARDQVRVTPPVGDADDFLSAGNVVVTQDPSEVRVLAGGTKAVFKRATGTLGSLEMEGVNVLGATAPGVVPGPRLTCMRAFTDNDCWLQRGCVDSGLTQLRYHARPIVVDGNRVRTTVEVTGSKSAGFTHEAVWAFCADGRIVVSNSVVPHGVMPVASVCGNPYQVFDAVIPRLGLSLRLDGALENVAYYGRGPHENYIDRCTAAFLGVWSSTVSDMDEPYVRPQDNGQRTDVRWVSFADASGRGVRFRASVPLFMQALHCDREDLFGARHQKGQCRQRRIVPKRGEVYLNLDIRQTGLGGRSCGPEPMTKSLFKIRPEKWNLHISPIREGPGTFFNPTDGNEVRTVRAVTNAVARRRIAFLGGSITEMNGFRPRLMTLLRAQHPDIDFVELAAGLSSTCSDTGAFRFGRDVLAKGVPDVLIVDAAVNDDQDGHFDFAHCIRGLEGIVRQSLAANPRCRIVLAQMVNHRQYDQLMKGEEPVPYAAAHLVARHYGAGVADIGTELVASARKGGFSWKEYKDCHPSPEGCDFVANVVLKAVNASAGLKAESVTRELPEPLDPLSYFNSREISLRSVKGGAAWKVMRPDWAAVPGSKRSYFTQGKVLCCSQTNELAAIRFEGTALAALLTAGPDAGDLEVSVDGGPFRCIRLRSDYGSLHYPYTQMLAEDLHAGDHVVCMRVRAAVEARQGTNVRINRLYGN